MRGDERRHEREAEGNAIHLSVREAAHECEMKALYSWQVEESERCSASDAFECEKCFARLVISVLSDTAR